MLSVRRRSSVVWPCERHRLIDERVLCVIEDMSFIYRDTVPIVRKTNSMHQRTITVLNWVSDVFVPH